jgi:hypothetical protein
MEKKAVYRKQDIGQLQPTFGHGFIVKQEKVGTKQHIKRDYQQHKSISLVHSDLLASTALLPNLFHIVLNQHP